MRKFIDYIDKVRQYAFGLGIFAFLAFLIAVVSADEQGLDIVLYLVGVWATSWVLTIILAIVSLILEKIYRRGTHIGYESDRKFRP